MVMTDTQRLNCWRDSTPLPLWVKKSLVADQNIGRQILLEFEPRSGGQATAVDDCSRVG